jgi:GMP synthase-like glutamine amidotransferase
MKPLYLFRHIECEGPGYLAEALARDNIPFELIAVDQNAPLPADTRDCSGLVFMGGPMSVNDPLPWIVAELDLIREGADRQLPVLGHCLGGQLISKALGGNVTANPVKEIGWHPVRKTRTAAASDWLGDIPDPANLFHWHGETFSIPAGATVILENDWCANQAFAVDNILALQCHVEMTAPMVREWASRYAHELREPSASVQDMEEITADLDARVAALQGVADSIYRRWLRPLLTG